MTPEHLIIIIFAVYHIFTQVSHARERRDLYNRLMAQDLSDYQVHEGKKPPPRSRNFVAKHIAKAYTDAHKESMADE